MIISTPPHFPFQVFPNIPSHNVVSFFFNNLLSAMCTAPVCMGVGPSNGAWKIYQWSHILKRNIPSPTTAISCQ